MFKKVIAMFMIAGSCSFASIEKKISEGEKEGYLVHRVEDNVFFIDEETRMVAVYSEDFKPISPREMQELIDRGQVIEGDREFFKSYSRKNPEAIAFSKHVEGRRGFILIFEDISLYSRNDVEEVLDIFEIEAEERREVIEGVAAHGKYL